VLSRSFGNAGKRPRSVLWFPFGLPVSYSWSRDRGGKKRGNREGGARQEREPERCCITRRWQLLRDRALCMIVHIDVTHRRTTCIASSDSSGRSAGPVDVDWNRAVGPGIVAETRHRRAVGKSARRPATHFAIAYDEQPRAGTH